MDAAAPTERSEPPPHTDLRVLGNQALDGVAVTSYEFFVHQDGRFHGAPSGGMPWRQAAAHLAILAFLGVVLAEFSFDPTQKIPFACSYLPGKSNLHVTLWLWIVLIFVGIVGAAVNERRAFENPAAGAVLLGSLAIAAAGCMLLNNRLAAPDDVELRFEEVQPGCLQSLDSF